MPEELLTMKEASRVLKISVADMHTLRRKGYVRCLKLGSFKVRRAELDRFIRESEGTEIKIERNANETV